ncbi:actinia tenebrosa protease inhibitors-like [Argiope bruennichi]|uniref:actinia tenebrosa protease inhibitors-like n=1 Tax=Argiope bruennichi TaxID=94029 RepID=UPI002495804D|nr:actinia tenebrosa protease inhibitors-like [Argiope bruennichi]
MKFLVLFVLVAGAFASAEDCPLNSHYEECGTACPLTCDNYENPPRACVLMCVSGCFCDEGYVKTEDGKCVKPERCAAEKKNCVDKPETGMCRGYFPMWYYDEDARDCKQFIYGGCQGNGNRYVTKEQCLKKCASIFKADSDRCSLPAETGLCRGYFPRYYFDKEAGQCKKFVYGGCGGNENNFATEEECESECGNRAAQVCGENERYNGCGTACPLTCENYDNPPKFCNLMCKIGCECENGFVRRADGKCVRPDQCPNRQAALDRPDCDKAPETGVCRAYMPRYYYDQQAGQCLKFIYGGCGGNRNNFETEEECYNKCGALQSFSREICNLEAEVGPCKAAFRRFFFNRKTGQCERFIYGGCQGNENNFETQRECENRCLV